MATETVRGGALPPRERVAVVASPPVKMSWGAIFGGAVAALAIWAMLYSLGLALGLSSVDPDNPGSIKGSSIFTGIWSVMSPLIALFVGGMVAGRSAGVTTRTGGALHGLVVWGVTTLAGAWLLTNIISSLVGGVAAVGKTAAQAGAGAVSSAAGSVNRGQVESAAQSFGLNADDALRPVNKRLQAEGKPTVTADQLQAAAKDVIREGVQQGRFDRELLVSNLAQNTGLSRSDAEEIATRVESQFNAAKTQVGEKIAGAAETVERGALKAVDATGKAFWGIFGALFLGMLSALLGATAGVSKRQQRWAEGSNVNRDVGLHSHREVYP